MPRHEIYSDGAEDKELSIIVPCYNGIDFTRMCLDSIYNSDLPSHEVIVIDDASVDSTNQIEAFYPEIDVLIRHTANKGFSPSINEGIKVALGDRIAIFNNDIVVPQNWYSCLREVWDSGASFRYEDRDYHIGMLSCEVVGPEPNYFGAPSGSQAFEDFMNTHMYIHEYSFYPLIPFKVGGPWLIQASVFNNIGYFDERFVPGTWEDIDFFLRMVINGYMFCTMQNCYIYHFGSETIKRYFPQLGGRGGICDTNRERFKEKWGVDTPLYVDPKIDWPGSLRGRELVLRDG